MKEKTKDILYTISFPVFLCTLLISMFVVITYFDIGDDVVTPEKATTDLHLDSIDIDCEHSVICYSDGIALSCTYVPEIKECELQ